MFGSGNLQWRNDDLQVYVARLEVNSNREHNQEHQ